MAINSADFSYFQSYQSFNEKKTIHDCDMNSVFISDTKKLKENIKNLEKEIFDLKTIVTNEDGSECIELTDGFEENGKIIFSVSLAGNAARILENIKQYLKVGNQEVKKKYTSVIFPDGEERNFSTDVYIEKKNFNRIHIRSGIPTILRGIGFGKKVYKEIIKKYHYVSTNKLDRTLDAINVWDSLRKDTDLYSFISMYDRMLCIDHEMDYDFVMNILFEFFKYDMEKAKKGEKNDDYVLDTDFRMKYYERMEKTELKCILEKPYNFR